MEIDTLIDSELRLRATAKRVAVLEAIGKSKPLSVGGAQIYVWFAVAMLALIAVASYRTHLNAAPYIAAVLIPVIGFIAGWMFRMQRRVEALVQLVVDDRPGVSGARPNFRWSAP